MGTGRAELPRHEHPDAGAVWRRHFHQCLPEQIVAVQRLEVEMENSRVEEAWNNNAQGYMSTPVVIDGHAYLHLQNQRFTCIDLRTGERTWTSKPFGKYCSMVAQGDHMLALDQKGILLLLKANPKEFELLDQRKVSDEDTWAHIAVSGDELFVRELNGLKTFRWSDTKVEQ